MPSTSFATPAWPSTAHVLQLSIHKPIDLEAFVRDVPDTVYVFVGFGVVFLSISVATSGNMTAKTQPLPGSCFSTAMLSVGTSALFYLPLSLCDSFSILHVSADRWGLENATFANGPKRAVQETSQYVLFVLLGHTAGCRGREGDDLSSFAVEVSCTSPILAPNSNVV